MDRIRLIGTGGVIVAVLGVAMALNLRGSEQDASVREAEPVWPPPSPATASSHEPQPASPISERRDDALLALVEHKYRYLFADIESAHVDELKRRLLDREANVDERRRENADASIGRLLSPGNFAYYQVLKDSDLEQQRLDEYTDVISSIAPLDERQERQVLDAKLRHKQRYTGLMHELGLDRESLTVAEREYAHTRAPRALKNYLDEYLLDVSSTLTPEQYAQLKNYESRESARELARIQQQINAE